MKGLAISFDEIKPATPGGSFAFIEFDPATFPKIARLTSNFHKSCPFGRTIPTSFKVTRVMLNRSDEEYMLPVTPTLEDALKLVAIKLSNMFIEQSSSDDNVWCLTFDMSSKPKDAKPTLEHSLNGRVTVKPCKIIAVFLLYKRILSSNSSR